MTINDLRSNILRTIAAGYRDMCHLPESDWDAAHKLLLAQLSTLGIDADTLPDTCRDRADRLIELANTR